MRRKNILLAAGVLLFSIATFLGVLFVLVLWKQPFQFMQRIVPAQALPPTVVSNGQNLYILTTQWNLDQRRPTPDNNRYFIYSLGDAKLSKRSEIPAFISATSFDGNLVVFYDGGYRTYNGHTWIDSPEEGVGIYPHGVFTSTGLYVINIHNDDLRMNQIDVGTTRELHFPAGFNEFMKEFMGFSFLQLVSYKDKPCLFWYKNNKIHGMSWDGRSWSPAPELQVSLSPENGAFRVAANQDSLHVITVANRYEDDSLQYYVYDGTTWHQPATLLKGKSIKDWDLLIHKNQPMIFIERPFFQELYAINNDGSVSKPISLGGIGGPMIAVRKALLIISAIMLCFLLYVFLLSAIVRHYKEHFGSTDAVNFEYASIFRRALAKGIDELILLMPAAVLIWWIMTSRYSGVNPLERAFDGMLGGVGYLFVSYLYFSFFEGLGGATPGKWLCGIRVVKEDLAQCGLQAAFLRNIMRIIDGQFNYLVAATTVAGTMKWQRLGDMAARTVVVIKR